MATSAGNAIFVLLLCTFFLASLACDGGGAKFGYTGPIAPVYWGNLSANFTRCATGKQQSPINIKTSDVVRDMNMEPLHRNYTTANATLVDNIFNIALRCEDAAGAVSINGKKYRLKQMHWHSPSEHTINGQRFPLELHLVHSDDNGNITVVAFLYRFGRPDPFFSQIQDKMAELYAEGCKAEKGTPIPAGSVSLLPLRQHVHMYFRYVGSLTTPPCTENVIWNIPSRVREMTREQAAALMAPLEEGYRHNNRPTQRMNGRTVQFYHRFWKSTEKNSP
uniref:Carbonic anhydrase n=1 Tax=Leersia perrieri TaxID=77586 RepID=A0A0D9W4N4_9ORYZ